MRRSIKFEPAAFDELVLWSQQDRKVEAKIFALLTDILRQPFEGLGKPEPLKHQRSWSRRITDEHRLVYQVSESEIVVLRCKGHYE